MKQDRRLLRYMLAPLGGATALVAVATLLLVAMPKWRSIQIMQNRERIDPYELTVAGDGDATRAPNDLIAILGDSRLRHWNRIQFVAFTIDNMIMSQGTDRRLRFWDPNNGKQMSSLPVSGSVAASGDGTKMFFANDDGSIEIWDTVTKSSRGKLPGHSGVQSVKLAADNDGGLLVSCATGRDSLEWKVWDSDQCTELRSVTAEGSATYLCLSHDGQLLASCNESRVSVWDASTGELRYEIGPFLDRVGNSRCVVYAIAFSPNGRHLITGDAGRRVRVWDAASGDEIGSLPEHRSGIRFVTFDRSANQLITGADTARFWWGDPTGKEWQLVSEVDWKDALNAAAFSPKGLIALAGDDHSLELYEQNGRQRHRLAGGDRGLNIQCLAWSPDSKTLATGSRDGSIDLWNVSRSERTRSWKGHTGLVHRLAFNPDGRSVASSSEDGSVAIWGSSTGKELRTFSGFIGPATSIAFSPDGQTLATGRTAIGTIDIQLWHVAGGGSLRSFSQDRGRRRGDIAFSPDGQVIAMGDTFCTVTLWDVPSGSIRAKLGEATVDNVPVAISPDRRFVAGSRDRSIKIWDLSDGNLVQSLEGHTAPVRSLAFSPDSALLASSANDGTVRLWLTSNGEEIKVLQLGPAGGMIRQIAISPDGTLLATVNGNGTVYVILLSNP